METTDSRTQESFDYISENLNVSFDAVPIELMKYWAIEDHNSIMDGTYELPEGDHRFSIFLYAYLLVMADGREKAKVEISEEKLMELYLLFQTFIAMRFIHDITDMKFGNIKLFDFKNYDKMKVNLQLP